VFWTSNDLFGLVTHLNMNDVGFTAFLMNDPNSSVVTPMGHAFVQRRLYQDGHLFSGLVLSKDSTQTNFAPLARLLTQKRTCP
jgi:hypothetical protein